MSSPLVAPAALEASGMSRDAALGHAARFARLERLLEHETAPGGRRHAWFVPGRIELLGKHTDYAGGRSLICATERGFCVLSADRADRRLSVTDLGRARSVVLDEADDPASGWSNYPATVLRRLRRNFPQAMRGAEVFFDSNLPSAAGLSSSSALMIAVLLSLVRANDLDSSVVWNENIQSTEDLAAYAATIENGLSFRALAGDAGVGTAGGSEDHTAILCSRPGEIAQYAYCPTRHERSIPLSSELLLAVGGSGVAARKTGGARDDYNRASERARQLFDAWRAATGRDDASLAAALASSPDAADRVRRVLGDRADGAALVDRLDQFVAESTVLVPTAADQLAAGDLAGFGATVARSQDLAERLLGNQVPETVALVRAARDAGAFAASAFGAGFGGSVWALVERSGAPEFLDRWETAYCGPPPEQAPRAAFFLTRPGPAAIQLR